MKIYGEWERAQQLFLPNNHHVKGKQSKGRTFAIKSTDSKLTESFEYMYKHVQEMSISEEEKNMHRKIFQMIGIMYLYVSI